MRVLQSGKLLRIAILGLMVAVFLPLEVVGQGRSRRVGIGLSKKCSKFVNCHDARDGRWDGRGPQRRLGLFDRFRIRNRRNRRFDDDDRRFRRRDRFEPIILRDNRGRGRRF